jgi:hypothetical protein
LCLLKLCKESFQTFSPSFNFWRSCVHSWLSTILMNFYILVEIERNSRKTEKKKKRFCIARLVKSWQTLPVERKKFEKSQKIWNEKLTFSEELLVTNKKSNCHKIKYKKFSKYFFSAIRSIFCSAGVIDAVKMHQLL